MQMKKIFWMSIAIGIILLKSGMADFYVIPVPVKKSDPPFSYDPDTIYVSSVDPTSRDDEQCGILINDDPARSEYPCLSISYGLNRANGAGKSNVRVSNGMYFENIVLIEGINLLGGYDNEFKKRDAASFHSIIIGNNPNASTVSANGIQSPTVFEGFVVFGPDATQPSRNSIAIRVDNSSSDLSILKNTIYAGSAANGSDGADGHNGADGQNGAYGLSAKRYSSGDTNHGGSGGTGISTDGIGINPNGGKGGTAVEPKYPDEAESGEDGMGGNSPGGGGSGGHDKKLKDDCSTYLLPSSTISGSDGYDGNDGAHGANGSGGTASNSQIVSGVWKAADGTDGTNGIDGSGGGGGGAGGGVEGNASCGSDTYVLGPSGGGGGAGGGAGTAGKGGKGGGGSFGIFLYLSTSQGTYPTLRDNEIYLGRGGRGGNGGYGGRPGKGGDGGYGGNADFDSGSAGKGGNGGDGGYGGNGGGGAGGISAGIFANFDANGNNYEIDNIFHPENGAGGEGGKYGGETGIRENVIYQP